MKKCLILLLTVFLLGCTLPAMGETNLQQQVIDLSAELDRAYQNLTAAEAALTQYEADQAQLIADNATLSQQVIDLSAELDRAYQNLTAAEVTLTQYEADQAQLLADNATLSQQVIDLSAELERAYQNLSAAEAALTQQEADQAQLLADNATLSQQVIDLSAELEAVKTDRDVQSAKAIVLESLMTDLLAKYDALAQQLSDLTMTAKLEAVQEQSAPADPVERKLTVPRKAPTVTPTEEPVVEEPVVEEPVVAEITYDIFAEDDLGNLVKVAAVTDMEGFVHTEVEDGNYVDFIDTDVGDDEIYFMAFYATAEEGLAFDREVFAATSQTISFGENMQTTIAGMDVKYFYYEDTYATDYEEVIMRGASAYIQVGEGTCVSVNVDTYRWVSEPQMDWPQVDNLIKLAVESLRLPV